MPWPTAAALMHLLLPVLILALVLGVLLDCRTVAGQVAVKLLDGTTVHSAARQRVGSLAHAKTDPMTSMGHEARALNVTE